MASAQLLIDEEKPPTYTEATGAIGPAGATGAPSGAAGGAYNGPPAGGYGTNYGTAPPSTYGPPPPGTYGPPPPGGYKPYQGQAYQGGYQNGGAGYPGPPPGYQPVVQQPGYMAGTVVVQQQPSVVVVGGCPACRIGVLEDDFTFLGVCCAILFFPLGILCCLAMRQRHCPNCGAVFS